MPNRFLKEPSLTALAVPTWITVASGSPCSGRLRWENAQRLLGANCCRCSVHVRCVSCLGAIRGSCPPNVIMFVLVIMHVTRIAVGGGGWIVWWPTIENFSWHVTLLFNRLCNCHPSCQWYNPSGSRCNSQCHRLGCLSHSCSHFPNGFWNRPRLSTRIACWRPACHFAQSCLDGFCWLGHV